MINKKIILLLLVIVASLAMQDFFCATEFENAKKNGKQISQILCDLYEDHEQTDNGKKLKKRKKTNPLNLTSIVIGSVALAASGLGYIIYNSLEEKNNPFYPMPDAEFKIMSKFYSFIEADNALLLQKTNNSRILGFYSNTQKIDVGADQSSSWKETYDLLIDNVNNPNAFFENSHKFIQWLFPLFTPSGYNRNTEVWTKETVEIFKNDPVLINRIIASFYAVVKGYYRLNINITKNGYRCNDIVKISIDDSLDELSRRPVYEQTKTALLINGKHNLLRISRILNCLKLLDLQNYAQAFFDCLSAIHDRQDIHNEIDGSFRIWHNIVRS